MKGKWVSRIQEYNLEIWPTKTVKGQGLAKMLTEGNEKALDIGGLEMVSIVLDEMEHHNWHSNIVNYLKNLSYPDHLRS